MTFAESKYGVPGPRAYTDEWYGLRVMEDGREPAFVIGASDASIVAGLSSYQTALDLYLEKRGLRAPKGENTAMEWGKRLEEPILKKYAEYVGVDWRAGQHMLHDRRHPFIVCTPDAFAWDVDAPDGVWLVEAKTSSHWRYSEEADRTDNMFGPGVDEVPKEYIVQAQVQMMVTGLSRVDIPVLFDGREFRCYTVHANDLLMGHIRKEIVQFYNDVCNAKPPRPDFEHPNTVGTLKALYEPDPTANITMTNDMADEAEEYLKLKDRIKAMEAARDIIQAKFIDVMKDAAVGYIEGSPLIIKRTQVCDTLWQHKDIDKAVENLGKVKRQGYQRFTIGQGKR